MMLESLAESAFAPSGAAVESGAVPGAVLGIVTADGTRATRVAGAAQLEPVREDLSRETWFDLASLTKVIFTTTAILRLVDEGRIDLDEDYRYAPSDGPSMTRTTREFLDRMITESDNDSAKALLKQLHDLGEVDRLNAELHDLGLGTLQIRGTDPASGAKWGIGKITMTSLDSARLLLLLGGGPGVLWRTEGGKRVRADDVLSRDSRAILLGMLADQGWNDVLTTANWCGRSYPRPGIPSLVADRWVDPGTGTVTVAGKAFGQDVRPCNERAEVSFAHKTGFTYNYLSDAGIVHSLNGEDGPRGYGGVLRGDYIVVMMSNLGYRYADRRQADATSPVCGDDPANDAGVCYTEKFAALGSAVDAILRRR